MMSTASATIHGHWDEVCDQALVTATERNQRWGREICNPYISCPEP